MSPRFLTLVAILTVIALVIRPFTPWAAWFGFLVAGYSAVANDSIQTLGTFLHSNRHRPWWHLWIWLSAVLAVTWVVGWATHDGDMSWGRLATKGFETAPTSFSIVQLLAPIVLIVVTRLGMPVSTTFLLLSCFATSRAGLEAVLVKSVGGYVVAFVTALAVWWFVARLVRVPCPANQQRAWNVAQWISTGFLWSAWLMQDAANVVVFLPRQVDGSAMAVVVVLMIAALGVLVRRRGGEIQQIVASKSHTQDIRAATVIDLVYAIILFGYTKVSTIPMSTTWVFIGLLAGREFMMATRMLERSSLRHVWWMTGKDLLRALVGLLISIILALLANPRLLGL